MDLAAEAAPGAKFPRLEETLSTAAGAFDELEVDSRFPEVESALSSALSVRFLEERLKVESVRKENGKRLVCHFESNFERDPKNDCLYF